MEIIRPDTNFDFLGKRKSCSSRSARALIGVGLLSLVMRGGPRYGIDFAGGTLIQVQLRAAGAAPTEIRAALAGRGGGRARGPDLRRGNEFISRWSRVDEGLEGLTQPGARRPGREVRGRPGAEVRRVEMVGPKVGEDLRRKGLLALAFAWGRSCSTSGGASNCASASGPSLALFHDVLITVGAFSSSTSSSTSPRSRPLLTIVGYSLNDTIVVFDRIRENMKKTGGKGDLATIINRSINETLSRTLLTSGTTLLVVAALFALGGGVIHDFAFALLVGVMVGTYSSIYIASPVVLYLEQRAHRGAVAGAKAG